jgi:hypothetical protein
VAWLSQGVPTSPASAPRFWHNVAHMVGNSNFRNPGVPTRPMPVGMPQHWQPPLSTNSTADAALKGLPS